MIKLDDMGKRKDIRCRKDVAIVVIVNELKGMMDTISSILGQTVRPGRIMVVDNCLDPMVSILMAKVMRENSGWIRLLKMPISVSLEETFNVGLKAVDGEDITYCAIMEAGETMEPDTIETAMGRMWNDRSDAYRWAKGVNPVRGILAKPYTLRYFFDTIVTYCDDDSVKERKLVKISDKENMGHIKDGIL